MVLVVPVELVEILGQLLRQLQLVLVLVDPVAVVAMTVLV
jgi:hypothetical protein